MRGGQRAASRRCPDRSSLSPLAFGLLLAVVLSLAAGLRFYRLDAQSFWNDEGNSARIAERSPVLIVEGAAGDIHPPGYYLLLHAWRGLFGQSEFALRSLSVVAGLVLVGFTALLGRWLFGPAAGLTAAALSALSPFAIYYSQEARMYALLGALSAASTVVAFRAMEALSARPHVGQVSIPADGGLPVVVRSRDGGRVSRIVYLLVYALVNAAGLYTHYAFAFVLIAHNAVFCLWWLIPSLQSEPRWRDLLVWGGAQVGTGLLYLPWVPVALDAAGWSSAGAAYRLDAALLDVLRVLVVGITQPLGEASVAMAVTGGVALLALWPRKGWRREEDGALPDWLGLASLVIYLVVPLGLFFGFDLYKPAWLKFLVVLLPSFHLLVALGVANVAALVSRAWNRGPSSRLRVSLIVAGTLVLVLAGLVYPSLQNLYFDPAYARDDYRTLAADVRAMERPGDAIVLNAPNQWEVFTYYYPDRHVYPAPYRPRPGAAAAFLDPLLEDYQRLFVIYWGDAESDPKKRVESWLASHAYKAGDRWYGDVRLATYGVAPLPEEAADTLDALFGQTVRLRGYSLPGGPFAPGAIIPVTLFWEASSAIEEPYKVSVQMLHNVGRLVGQIDTVPGDGLAPTTSWEPGASLIDRYGVRVPQQTSSGRYTVIVAVYHAVTGERLPVVIDGEPGGDHISLGHVTVGSEGR